MNEELQTKLLEYLNSIEGTISEASDFARAELPLVAQEYLAWVWWGNLVLLIAGGVGLLVGIGLMRWSVKATSDDGGVILAMGGIVLTVCGSLLTIPSTSRLVKVSVAPRVVLIEKIKELGS